MKGILTMEMNRLFRTFRFWMAPIGLAILCLIASWESVAGGVDTVVNCLGKLTELKQFDLLIVLFATIPFGTCFCQEWKDGFFLMVAERKSLEKYTAAMLLTACFAAYVTIMAGLAIYLGILDLRLTLTHVNIDLGYFEGDFTMPYGALLESGHAWGYLLCRMHLIAVSAVFYVGLGVAASAIFPDDFAAVAMPMILKYCMERITDEYLPRQFNLWRLTQGYRLLNGGLTIHFIYIFLLVGFVLLAAYLIFLHCVRRRMELELC